MAITWSWVVSRLPVNPGDLAPQQNRFLDAAVEQLSEEGRVICVRLALFGDLVKGKPWTLAALEQAGGAAGLGVTFLEDSFTASSASEAHRRHEKGARKLLRTLLPESDSDIILRFEEELRRHKARNGKVILPDVSTAN